MKIYKRMGDQAIQWSEESYQLVIDTLALASSRPDTIAEHRQSLLTSTPPRPGAGTLYVLQQAAEEVDLPSWRSQKPTQN